jgi:hypothetical protein
MHVLGRDARRPVVHIAVAQPRIEHLVQVAVAALLQYIGPARIGSKYVLWPNVTLLGGLGEAAELFDAIMYVLWDPAIPPAGQPNCTPATTSLNYKSTASTCASIPVPLGSVEWKWSACTINQLAAPAGVVTPSWIKQCGPGFSYPAAAGGYPTWNSCDTSDIGKC